jgi:predicted permease
MQSLIMVGQVAMACVLLVGAVLLSRSFLAMMHADRGYDVSNLLSIRVLMPDFLIKADRRVAILDETLSRGRTLPGVSHIAFVDSPPLSSGENLTAFTMPSQRPPLGAETRVNAVRRVVSQDYFRVLNISALQGRVFASTDTANSSKVVVVNRLFASRYLSNRPVGDQIVNFFQADGVPYDVIGVIPDVMQKGLQDSIQPEIYSLNLQMPANKLAAVQNYLLRIQGDPRGLIDPLRNILREQDPAIMIDSVMTMEDRLSTSLAKPRLYAVLLITFAVSALLISAVGLFGVLSYNVAQRAREFAIRNALGATPANLLSLVFINGLVLTAGGVGVGLGLSVVFVGYLKTLLYGVTSHDAVSIAVVCATTVAMALVACLVPAIRAVKTDPIASLRA